MKTSSPSPVSGKETLASLLILVTLVGVAIGVWQQQTDLNPAVRVHQEISAGDAALARPNAAQPMSLPDGLQPMTPPEVFFPQTLYEKIDGKAELYLSAGFKALRTQRIRISALPDQWMEVYIYDMGTPANAFSVFSMQRRDDGEPLDLVKYAYQTPNALFMAHGSFYVEVIASEASPRIQPFLQQFAAHFARSGSAANTGLDAFSLFPETCSDSSGRKIIPASAFGFDQLNRIYTAPCDHGGKTRLLFLSDRGSKDQASGLAAAYADFLLNFGGSKVAVENGFSDVRVIEIFGSYELIFTVGKYLCGIHEADDPTAALNQGRAFYLQLIKKVD